MPVNPSQRKLWRMSHMGCSLRVSLSATLCPQLGWMVGHLPITTGRGALALFLRKNHSFHHLANGLETEKRNYGSIPGPVWT
jgi:hypothetical protein